VRTAWSLESNSPEPTVTLSWAVRMTGGPCRAGSVCPGTVVVPPGWATLFEDWLPLESIGACAAPREV